MQNVVAKYFLAFCECLTVKRARFLRLLNVLLILFSGESALGIVIKKVTEGLHGVEKQEATTEK